MTEEIKQEVGSQKCVAVKQKTDVVVFKGEKPLAINMAHVCGMRQEGQTLYFDFYTKTQPIVMADEAIAEATFKNLIDVWSGNVVE